MSLKGHPKPRPICPYCGMRDGTEKDHVIADCFYTVKPIVGNITVKVCRQCADAKAKDDIYLAHIAQTYHLTQQQHPVAKELSEGKLMRATARHQSDLARDIVNAFQDRDLDALDDSGQSAIGVDGERVSRLLRLITRGLYAHYFAPSQLPQDCAIGVKRVVDEEIVTRLPPLVAATPIGPIIVGDQVAMIRYGVNPKDSTDGLWLLVLYRGLVYTMRTHRDTAMVQ